ncbi:MAG TPA: glycosyltransferase family 4 protein, partial [Longimicrobiales bacterium]|nr:glycosyltransferase family 4 protein [Longimicrobiales bacterium]
MKILMHCVYYPPEVGGLESHVHYLCRALAERGHRVDVVTSRSVEGTPAYEVREGVHVWRTWFPGKSTAGWIGHAVGSVRRTLKASLGADILHAQAFQSVPPLHLARGYRGVPLVATWHTSHFLRLARRPGWRQLLGGMVRSVDRNLAASREIADVAESLAPGTAVEAVTNGVETSLFRPVEPSLPPPEAGRRRIIVPRRLFEKNGVEYFVRALPAVAEEVDVEAVVVGDGPERPRLEALAEALGVADRIRFLGGRAHGEMPALLSSAEVAVFPSLMEATSVAALECMACGVPVAASRVGGLPEIVDETVGGLFEPADPESLAATVLRLLARPDLREMGRRARERVVARWSNDRLAERHLEIYEALVEGKPVPPP